MDRVIEVNDLVWGFDANGPTIKLDTGFYGHHEKVDPAPGYAHNLELVKKTLALCEAVFPVSRPPKVFVAKYEGLGRTNAHTSFDHDYKKNDAHDRPLVHPYIFMSGKRIPMHPAMTRYLVAHEYGHVVDTLLAYERYNDKSPESKQDEEYIKLRGMNPPSYYGPGMWHATPSEVFANDFRVFVCGVEPEFWPHTVPPPQQVPAVADWWKARLYEVAETRRREAEAASVRKDGQTELALACS